MGRKERQHRRKHGNKPVSRLVVWVMTLSFQSHVFSMSEPFTILLEKAFSRQQTTRNYATIAYLPAFS